MPITYHIFYSSDKAGNAIAFVEEMEQRGIADRIRAKEGNLQYAYFTPLHDNKTVLLIDSWANQDALDAHHASPMMAEVAALRETYDLHMRVERFVAAEDHTDDAFMRK